MAPGEDRSPSCACEALPDVTAYAANVPARPVLVSACLVGVECTHKGGSETASGLLAALDGFTVLPFCPEVEGGLGVPRSRAEVERGDGAAVLDGQAAVRTADATEVTDAYVRGARAALDLARGEGVELAVLKSRSPSCGCGGIYDGTHTRTLLPDGVGVTAALLSRRGFRVVDESCGPEILRRLAAESD